MKKIIFAAIALLLIILGSGLIYAEVAETPLIEESVTERQPEKDHNTIPEKKEETTEADNKEENQISSQKSEVGEEESKTEFESLVEPESKTEPMRPLDGSAVTDESVHEEESGKHRGWYKDATGTYYYDEKGNKVTGWQNIDGKRYYFNHQGVMSTGWLELEGKRYLLGEDGAMIRGWKDLNNKRYFFNKDGVMKTEWLKQNEKYYYFDSQGIMIRGWKTIKQKTYYFNQQGVMQTGWKNHEGHWYYFNEDGSMFQGWLTLSGKSYYLQNNGKMAEKWLSYKDKWYYLLPGKGEMLEGWQNIEGKWYYLLPVKGAMIEGWQSIKGKWYYLLPRYGSMAEGWQLVDGEYYYLQPEKGYCLTSQWFSEKDKWYYLTESGKAAKGWLTVNGRNYLFDDKTTAMILDGSKPALALTFDDGPGAYTQELLDYLKQQQVSATFFVLGGSIPGREYIIRRQYDEGHTIGNHSYNHPALTTLSDGNITWQIDETDRLIRGVTGHNTLFYRPPYGDTNSRVVSLINKSSILWSVDTLDWKNRDSNYVENRIINSAADGAIILLHDIHQTSVQGVKRAIPALKAKGYQLVNLETLFHLKGRTPNPHQVYSSLE